MLRHEHISRQVIASFAVPSLLHQRSFTQNLPHLRRRNIRLVYRHGISYSIPMHASKSLIPFTDRFRAHPPTDSQSLGCIGSRHMHRLQSSTDHRRHSRYPSESGHVYPAHENRLGFEGSFLLIDCRPVRRFANCSAQIPISQKLGLGGVFALGALYVALHSTIPIQLADQIIQTALSLPAHSGFSPSS